MATTRVLQTITSGLREYFGSFTPAEQYDTFEFEFEEEVTIEDLVITMSSSSESWQLNLIYPSSGITSQITTGNTGSWTLNDYNREKQWFRVPPKTILQWKVDAATPTESVTMLVIGLG